MKKNKLFISLFLTGTLLTPAITARAADVTESDFGTYGLFLYDGLPYHLLDDGTVELCNADNVKGSYVAGNSIQQETVTIPAVVSYGGKDYNVTAIGDYAFQGCTSVKTVSIPEGVTVIGYQAFYNATNVELATGFPSTLKEIKGNCFYMCRNLGKIVLPEGLTTLWDGCFTRTFDMGGNISELVFPGTLTTITNEFDDFGTICSDRSAGTIGKITFNANSEWEDLRFSFNTFSRGVNCKEIEINRDLVNYDEKWSPVNIAKVTGLETLRFGNQVTKIPDLSGLTSLTTIYCDAPVPPSGLNLAESVKGNISVIVPDKYAAAYAADPAWGAYVTAPVEPSPVNAYVDFSKIGYTVGEGDRLGAVMITWNDGPRKGVDNLIYGVRFNNGATPGEIVDAVVQADSRLQRIGTAGYAYDNMDKGSVVEMYDHYADSNEESVWNIYSDEKPVDGSVIYLVYEPKDKDTSVVAEAPKYPFYIPAADVIGGRFPENYEMPIADEMIIPVWARTGGTGHTYAYFAWDAGAFKINTQGKNQAEQAEGRPYVRVDFEYFVAQPGGGVQGPQRNVPAPRDVMAQVNLSTYGSTAEKVESTWSAKMPMKIVAPEKPITKIKDTRVQVGGSMPSTPLRDLVDYEPADATYTRFFLEFFDENFNTVPFYRQDVYPAPWTEEAGQHPGYEYWLEEMSVSSGATSAILNLKYFYGLEETGDNEYRQADGVEGMLSFEVAANPVKAVSLDGDFDGEIELTAHDLLALRTKAMPASANQSVLMTIENATDENIATAYPVSGYMPDGVTMGKFTELVTYRAGEFDLVLTSAENKNVSRSYHVVVKEQEMPDEDFKAGIFWLNEEWFTHKNGSLNYLTAPVVSSDEEIIYRPYTTINDNAGFGATSQYGMIFGDKLFVMSKQAHDAGDIRGQVGGRLVVADANTLKTIASFSEIGGDGRACVGVRAGKAYIGHHAGVRVLTWDENDNMTLADADIPGIINTEEGDDSTIGGNQSLYNQQIGDMVAGPGHAFVMQQGKGLHIIDTDTDTVVKTISDANIGAITQTADGMVWYATSTGASAGHSMLHSLNPLTLEEEREPVEVPGVISTGWGSWRSNNFFSSVDRQMLFWNGSASSIVSTGNVIYAWDTESDPTDMEPLYTFPKVEGINGNLKQELYASMRYDDRVGAILFATTTSPNANYRYNWLNFLNVDDLSVESVRLKDYYWFPALPIFPDVFAPEMEEIDDIELTEGGAPVQVNLNATDLDHIDSNIRFSLVDNAESARSARSVSPVEASIDGRTLTVTPKEQGEQSIGIAVESNGRVSYHAVNVNVKGIGAGVGNISGTATSIRTEGRDIVVTGYNGVSFRLIDAAGNTVERFVSESDSHTHHTALLPGIYVIAADNGTAKKLIIR